MHLMEFWHKLLDSVKHLEYLLSIFVIQISIFYVNLLGYNAHNDYILLLGCLINIYPRCEVDSHGFASG